MLFWIEYTSLICDECCQTTEEEMCFVGIGLLFCKSCAPELFDYLKHKKSLWSIIGGKQWKQRETFFFN